MIGIALSDLHLGFRSFSASVDGRNQREVDTERAWKEAVDHIVAVQPDIVTIAGDVFHHPRVSDYAKRAFLTGIRRILEEATAVIVILQGNHDAGRTSDVLTPIALAEGWDERIYVVTEPTRIRIPVGGITQQRDQLDMISTERPGEKVSVACFPFVVGAGDEKFKLDPDLGADVNILLMHAAVKGSAEGDRLPYFYGASDQALDVGREADRWDAVLLGDFHEFTRLHPSRLAFYSGSLERTSNNIWAEYNKKGVVRYDTRTGEMELLPVWNRKMSDYDLGDFDFHPGVGAEELNQCLAKMTGYDSLEGTIVRFKVDAFPREEREHIDWSLVRQLRSQCTHFYLDIRYAALEVADLGDRRDRKTLSLAEEWASFSKDDDEAVRNMGTHYLDLQAEVEDADEAEEVET